MGVKGLRFSLDLDFHWEYFQNMDSLINVQNTLFSFVKLSSVLFPKAVFIFPGYAYIPPFNHPDIW